MRSRLALLAILCVGTVLMKPVAAPAVTIEPSKPAIRRGNQWFLRNTPTTGQSDITFAYGSASDFPLFGDWDGNGSKTPGVVRGNVWYLRNSNSAGNADIVFTYGSVGDIPYAGDWDNDGDETPGVVRGGGNCQKVGDEIHCVLKQTDWFLRNANSSGVSNVSFTTPCPCGRVIPTIGDWDATAGDDPGYRPLFFANRFFLDTGKDYDFETLLRFGVSNTDFPISGDWDADGADGIGVVRGNVWYLRNTLTDGTHEASFTYGSADDRWFLVWR